MLMRADPFREIDRLAQQLLGATSPGTWTRPAAMPIDTYRKGDEFVVAFDLPGVSPDAIDIDVERNVLTVKAERRPLDLGADSHVQIAERPLGVFARQLFLTDGLDTEHIDASYHDGILILRIPVAEHAKPRKVAVTVATDSEQKAVGA
jgi:HSP20 family protein